MKIHKDIVRNLAQAAQDMLDTEEEMGIGPDLEADDQDAHEYRSRMLYKALAAFNSAVHEDHTLATSPTSPWAHNLPSHD